MTQPRVRTAPESRSREVMGTSGPAHMPVTWMRNPVTNTLGERHRAGPRRHSRASQAALLRLDSEILTAIAAHRRRPAGRRLRAMPNDSRRTVLVSLGAGLGVALAKAGAAAFTGSRHGRRGVAFTRRYHQRPVPIRGSASQHPPSRRSAPLGVRAGATATTPRTSATGPMSGRR